MKYLSSILLSIILIGCATGGTKVDTNKLSQIKEGVTTKEEVVQLLGKPYMVNLNSDGKTVLMYQYTKASNRPSNFIPGLSLLAGGIDMQQQIVQILLDKNDKVEKFISNDSNSAMNYGLLNTNK